MNLLFIPIGILTLYIFICTYSDIKTKTVSIPISILSFLLILTSKIIIKNFNLDTTIMALLPGIVLCLISLITKQALGLGDCIIMLIIGISTNISFVIFVIVLAFTFSCLYGLFLLILTRKRNIVIPFVPFILIGYLFALFFHSNLFI